MSADMSMNREAQRRPGPAADDPFDAADPLELAVARLRDAPPGTDLWPGIEARLAPRTGTARVVSFTLPQLAMAATLLIAVSAGVSWLALGPKPAPVESGPAIR